MSKDNSDLGCAAIILALCLGLSSCMLTLTYVDKMEAETKILKQQLKLK